MSLHQRPQNQSQELADRSSLNNLELASLKAYNLSPEDNIASLTPLPNSIHESLDAQPLTVSQNSAESHSSTPSSESRNNLPDILSRAGSSNNGIIWLTSMS